MTLPKIYVLPNGITVVSHYMTDTQLVHCGFTLDIGARDETIEQQGIAHFWEHMAFKGTKKRKAFHIINRLETVGGELNAFTTKEKICFHASVLHHYVDQAIELLSDITFYSIFPERQIEKERNVILEEMAMYQDSPEDNILDEFDEQVFENHSLGRNILGTEDTVKSFKKEDFNAFIQSHFSTEKTVFSIVGNFDEAKIQRMINRYFGNIPTVSCQYPRNPFKIETYKPSEIVKTKPLNQSQIVWGKPTFGLFDKKRMPFFLLNNILGGPGLNSRLNLSIREKHGYVYHIDSNYHTYTDTGLFYINFGTAPKLVDRCMQLVHKELQKLKTESLGVLQLKRAKQQLMGQLAMAEESKSSLMLMYGKAYLNYGYIPTLSSLFDQIENTSSQDILEVANDVFDESTLSLLRYKPEDQNGDLNGD